MKPISARVAQLFGHLVIAADVAALGREQAWVVSPFISHPAPGSAKVDAGELMPYRVDAPSVVMGPGPVRVRIKGPGLSAVVAADTFHVWAEQAQASGERAYWELFELVEPMAHAAVERAHSARVSELAESSGRPVMPLMDSIGLQTVVDSMMTAPGGSFERITRLALSHTRFHKVGVVPWLRQTIGREAWQEVGRAIGDVRPGPRIRRMAHATAPNGLSELTRAFNSTVTASHRVSEQLAQRALDVASAPPPPLSLEQLQAGER